MSNSPLVNEADKEVFDQPMHIQEFTIELMTLMRRSRLFDDVDFNEAFDVALSLTNDMAEKQMKISGDI